MILIVRAHYDGCYAQTSPRAAPYVVREYIRRVAALMFMRAIYERRFHTQIAAALDDTLSSAPLPLQRYCRYCFTIASDVCCCRQRFIVIAAMMSTRDILCR